MGYAHYSELAALFDFPGPGFADRGRLLAGALRENYPVAARHIERFLEAAPGNTLHIQELHTRTFDVQALTTLDVGFILFGDDYKRGELLSNLTREHNEAGNDCARELADHLPNVLRLIPKLKDRDLRIELVEQILVPALMLMIREFDPERIEKKNANYRKHYKALIDHAPSCDSTIYCHLLQALLHVLAEDFAVSQTMDRLSEWSRRRQTMDFLRLVEREMRIERDANPVNSGCDA